MNTVLTFGDCEMDLAAKELRVQGRLKLVEPRVFSLLAHLARWPGRVVSKQELLDSVWAGRRVSDAALARTVMKARQAVGDTGDSSLIRTVQRVGYRLDAPAKKESLSLDTGIPQALRCVAVLPFENATGDTSLDWASLGLMALVTQGLAGAPGVRLPATGSLLAAVDGAQIAGVDKGDAVRMAVGAEVVVHGRVLCTDERFSLNFECGDLGHGSVDADTVGELAPLAVFALRSMLRPDSLTSSAPPEAVDPLATAAFARGLQAMSQQKFGPAANLLRMALILSPGSVPVELELLRALAFLADQEASQPIAEKLLAQAQRVGDKVLAARVHLALARMQRLRSFYSEASSNVQEALRLLGSDGPLDEQALGHQLRAELAAVIGDYPAVESAMESLQAACERSGDRVRPISRLVLLGNVADARSEFHRSAEFFVQAANDARAIHAQRLIVVAEGNAACSLVQLGRWSEASSHAEQAYAAATLLKDRVPICNAIVTGAYVYMIAGVPAASQRVVDALPAFEDLLPMERQWAMLARAYHAVCSAEYQAAVPLLLHARRLRREGGNANHDMDVTPWLVYALVRCGRLDEAESELVAATSSAEQRHRELRLCRAHLLHARATSAEARKVLHEMVREETIPLWRAWATLDAAWLEAEADHGPDALALLKALPTEFVEHGVAHAVAARAHFAAGNHDAARRHHRRFLESDWGRHANPFLKELGDCYTKGSRPPPSHGLPTRL